MKVYLFTFLLVFCSLGLQAAESFFGYTNDVKIERSQQFYEVFIFSVDQPKQKKLNEVIFNPELSKEFRLRYQEKFGQVDAASIAYQSTKVDFLEDYHRSPVQIEQEYKDRKVFGEFMLRRTTEWHVDNYLKTEPSMQPVYEAKERLSHLEVEVTPESKFDFRYSLSGNTLDVIYLNPWLDSKWIIEMDPTVIGLTKAEEERLLLSKDITKTVNVRTNVATHDGIALVEISKNYPNLWTTSIGHSTYTKPIGKSPRESRVLFGVSHSF